MAEHSEEAYQTELKELQESQGFDLRCDPHEWGGQILSWVIFLGLMVVVMFLMQAGRRACGRRTNLQHQQVQGPGL